MAASPGTYGGRKASGLGGFEGAQGSECGEATPVGGFQWLRRLDAKISLLAAGSAFVAALALVLLAAALSSDYNALAQREVDSLVDEDLGHVTTSAYNLVRAEDEAVRQAVASSLNVARRMLGRSGGISESRDKVSWSAINQFSGSVEEFVLPRVLLGGRALPTRPNRGGPCPSSTR